MVLYLIPKNRRKIATVTIGDNAFIVWTNETGTKEVALWDVNWPVNWNTPMGTVVERINGVGDKILKMLAFNGGMQPGGKAFAASKTITSLRRATDSTIFNKNWHSVKVTGWLNCRRIILVELLEKMETMYQRKHKPTTRGSNSLQANRDLICWNHEAFFVENGEDCSWTGDDTFDNGGVKVKVLGKENCCWNCGLLKSSFLSPLICNKFVDE